MGIILDSSIIIAAERRGHTVREILEQVKARIASLSADGRDVFRYMVQFGEREQQVIFADAGFPLHGGMGPFSVTRGRRRVHVEKNIDQTEMSLALYQVNTVMSKWNGDCEYVVQQPLARWEF